MTKKTSLLAALCKFCSILLTRSSKYIVEQQSRLNKGQKPKRNSEIRTFPYAVDLDDESFFETLKSAVNVVC